MGLNGRDIKNRLKGGFSIDTRTANIANRSQNDGNLDALALPEAGIFTIIYIAIQDQFTGATCSFRQ